MASFLIEVIGLTPDQVTTLRNTSTAQDTLGIVAATPPREAAALAEVDWPISPAPSPNPSC